MGQYRRVVELWQSYIIVSSEAIDKYLDSFRILFAFHSGNIENEEVTYHDTREIFENSRVVGYTAWGKVLTLADGIKSERKGLSDFPI